MIPVIADLERMKAGGEHFAFHPEEPCYWGVLPRYGAIGEEVKVRASTTAVLNACCANIRQTDIDKKIEQWFKAPGGTMGHLSNVYENEQGLIYADLVVDTTGYALSLPGVEGDVKRPPMPLTKLRRQTIDPHSNDLSLPKPEIVGEYDSEFPRFDERHTGKDYTHTFLAVRIDSNTDWEAIQDKKGSGFMYHNTLGHFNHKTHEWRYFNVGRTSMVQEPVFTPRTPDAVEGDGFVIAVVSRFDTYSTDLIILDTRDWTKEKAIVHLPCKLRFGIHGNWVNSADRAETVIPNLANGHVNGH